MFWCTKNVKFHFQWKTKPWDQKQGTGYDCDVISGLEVSGKTDFSDIFLFSYKQHSCTISWRIHYLKIRKWLRNVFSFTITPSHVFFVLQFHIPPEVKFHVFDSSKHGERKSVSNIFCFAILAIVLWRFYRAKKKNCHMYFNLRLLWAAHGMYLCASVSKRVFVWNLSYKNEWLSWNESVGWCKSYEWFRI